MIEEPSLQSPQIEPDVTVVIGNVAPEASLDGCLAALESQRHRAQVVVVEAHRSSDALRARYPWVEFYERPGALVPELWRDGIARARGRIVALTIAQMAPAADWIDTIIEEHEHHDAVGGAIDPGERLRRVDWAEYLCRYAREIAPFEASNRDDIAGDNASYKRALLVEESAHLQSGFWEPVIHPVLRGRGVGLWLTPRMLVRQGRSCGFSAFAHQRSKHGRLYPRQRGEQFTRTRHAIGVLAFPIVPFIMTLRVLQNVFAKKRFRAEALAALPIVFALNVVWGFAEARGHFDLVRGR
jgi:hypothetical protein